MNFEGPLEDRLQIRELYGTYSDAAFRKDADAWLANWADDCVWFTFGQEFHGKAAMRAQWEQVWTIMDKMAFFAEVAAIQVQGDRATGRCYCHEILFLKAGGVRKVIGAYEDQLVRQDGVWRFARRDYRVLGDEGAWTGTPG
jgi:uncharacterized protein (TIGR02246 family)